MLLLGACARERAPCVASWWVQDGATAIELAPGCRLNAVRVQGTNGVIYLLPDSLQIVPMDSTHRPARTVPLPGARKT